MNITVAVVSDTHAHLDPRIADLVSHCDYAIHAGDICGAHVLEEMKPKRGKVYAVAGNNDFPPYFGDVQESLEIDLPGGKIAVEHGHLHGMQKPSHESLRKMHPDAKVIVYGHTHKMIQDREASPWIVNPGAAGQTRTRGGPSCLIIECAEPEWLITEHRFSEKLSRCENPTYVRLSA